jgi:RHS repeat-associated protein
VGTPGQSGYKAEVEAKTITYNYNWTAAGQLSGANKQESGVVSQFVMSYYYNASGNRVIREKSDFANGNYTNIRQDLYIAGNYERRGVELVPEGSLNPTTVNDSIFTTGTRGDFDDTEGARLVKYASGVRIDRDFKNGVLGQEKWFLSFNNHLGSTSAVIDFDTGALVEWSTQYAYGADESHWKNRDAKYTDNDDNFTSFEPYTFTGKEEDKEVGLFYFGARYYSAYLGRWLSPDPPVIHRGGVTNLYNYGANSPYIYVDPDGNFAWGGGSSSGFFQGGGSGYSGDPVGTVIDSATGTSFAGSSLSWSLGALNTPVGKILAGPLGPMINDISRMGSMGMDAWGNEQANQYAGIAMDYQTIGKTQWAGNDFTSNSQIEALAEQSATMEQMELRAEQQRIQGIDPDQDGLITGIGANTGSGYQSADDISSVDGEFGSGSLNDPKLVENSSEQKTLIIVGDAGEDGKNIDIANEWKGASAEGSIVVNVSGAKTVAEADKLIIDAAGDAKFDRVYFIGHGDSEDGILLGGTWVSPKNEGWGSFVGTIRGVTTENAGVGFYACRLGRGDILATMAKDLGGNRWVGGFKNYLGISNKANPQGRAYWTSDTHIGPRAEAPKDAIRRKGLWGGFNAVFNEPEQALF